MEISSPSRCVKSREAMLRSINWCSSLITLFGQCDLLPQPQMIFNGHLLSRNQFFW